MLGKLLTGIVHSESLSPLGEAKEDEVYEDCAALESFTIAIKSQDWPIPNFQTRANQIDEVVGDEQ